MTTLLRQIQDGATDHSVPVTDLLRKALILSQRLDYPPLREWAEGELEGYPQDAELPSYRAYRHCQVLGTLNGPMNSMMRNQPLPSSAVDEEHRRNLFGYELRDGIPMYEALLAEESDLSMPWDPDFVVHYQDAFFELMALTNARRTVPRAELSQLVEAVRTRLLNFSLEIEGLNPDAGEIGAGSHSIPEATVRDAFHLTVLGDNNVVNAAGHDANQTVSFDDGRWEQLRSSLSDLGVPERELQHLQNALEEDSRRGLPAGSMGPATANWYEKLSIAVSNGAIALTEEVAASMIAAELLKFLSG